MTPAGSFHPTSRSVSVLFSKWAGTDVLIGGEDRLILNEADILGVIEASRA